MIISIALGLVGVSLPLGTNALDTKDPPKGGLFVSTPTEPCKGGTVTLSHPSHRSLEDAILPHLLHSHCPRRRCM